MKKYIQFLALGLFLVFPFFIQAQNAQPVTSTSNLEVQADLEKVMDIGNSTQLLEQLEKQKAITKEESSALNNLKLSILYHDAAALYMDTWKAERRELAEKAYTILTILATEPVAKVDLLPYIKAYHASTATMLGAAYRNSALLDQGFALFEQAIDRFGEDYYLPLYLRAKMAQHLPFPYTKCKVAKSDYTELIDKYGLDNNYAAPKAMSFAYVAWAELHPQKKHSNQAQRYLQKAIQLDPTKAAAAPEAKKLLESHYKVEQTNL